MHFDFDSLGHLTHYTNSLQSIYATYTYDDLNRLTTVNSNLYPQNYSYDDLGNLTQRDDITLRYIPLYPHR